MSDDWDTKVIIGQKRQVAKVTKKDSDLNDLSARRTGAVVATDKKVTAGSNKAHQGSQYSYKFRQVNERSDESIIGTDHQRIAKLDRENEVAPPPKIAPSVGKAMQTARLELKMSQKDLAQKVNEKPSVIQDYESSKATPNPQILGKLERALGVKLRGADIGKKLDGPKKT
ncbi:hypothetical protein CVT26_004491 [Gymnopilus dilepis]|uniref:HTH cro/C1-type domain-containing protein n=1 Tax=Gymnopilus dilepis TaxID=231916 RepID=A0A409W6P3_9AGAR|nr:hypothetical protein CVT26_004491 [Gymnopilus dilepis]